MNRRIEIIQQAIDRLPARTYLEIGVAGAATFLALNAPRKIGVDPKRPSPLLREKADGVSVQNYQMTSDEFFAAEAPRLFAEDRIDVAFVDGLHEWRQAVRDVEHCLHYLAEPGIIIMHDCSPTSELIATPWAAFERLRGDDQWPGGSWCGDTFKAIAWLRSIRRRLHIFVLDCDWGLGIVTRGNPESLLAYTPDQIDTLTYADLDADRERLLNLKDPDYFENFLREISLASHSKGTVPYSC